MCLSLSHPLARLKLSLPLKSEWIFLFTLGLYNLIEIIYSEWEFIVQFDNIQMVEHALNDDFEVKSVVFACETRA